MEKLIPGLFVIWVVLLGCTRGQTHSKSLEIQRLALLAKSWGVMKYHHPDVGMNLVNWDSVLVANIESVDKVDNNEDFNELLNTMIRIPSKESKKPNLCEFNETESAVNYEWLNSELLNLENQDLLRHTILSKGEFNNVYVSDLASNRKLDYARFYDNPMTEADMSITENRLLGLFRYWNIIEYFFPYKDLTDKNWDDVLYEYIPRFISSDTKVLYYEELLKLNVEINDGHGNIPYHPDLRRDFFGNYTVPFTVRFIENKLVVDGFKSDSLAELSGIERGDQIISIDKEETSKRAEELGSYLSNPNRSFNRKEISSYILSGNSDSLNVTLKRGEDEFTQLISRYTYPEIRKSSNSAIGERLKMMADSVLYVHMGLLNQESFSELTEIMSESKKLVLDFRHYPNWEIFQDVLDLFYTEEIPFAKLKSQCLKKPGTYYWHYSSVESNRRTGQFQIYERPVILLVDENTFSFGEFFVMAMQPLENVTVVGSQTAGSDGNQVGIDMPGGIRMFISSLGIYYPDKSNSQRSGIRIDYKVHQTLNDFMKGVDTQLKYALKY